MGLSRGLSLSCVLIPPSLWLSLHSLHTNLSSLLSCIVELHFFDSHTDISFCIYSTDFSVGENGMQVQRSMLMHNEFIIYSHAVFVMPEKTVPIHVLNLSMPHLGRVKQWSGCQTVPDVVENKPV